jgi:hypothetical protein
MGSATQICQVWPMTYTHIRETELELSNSRRNFLTTERCKATATETKFPIKETQHEAHDRKPLLFLQKRAKTHLQHCGNSKDFRWRTLGSPLQGEGKGRGGDRGRDVREKKSGREDTGEKGVEGKEGVSPLNILQINHCEYHCSLWVFIY